MLISYQPPSDDEAKDDDRRFALPEFLRDSSLARKINDRLVSPFNAMTTFFFRRSVEKAFQLDEPPSGLNLNLQKSLKADPPHITSAVDDIMYIVNKVLQQSLATSQETVVTNVVPTLSRVLGSDFIGMTQRKMRDECYPRAAVQGGQPPEQTIVSFLVQINNLDIGVDYIRRIVQNNTGSKQPLPASTAHQTDLVTDHIRSLFPSPTSALRVAQTLHSLATSFESKVNDLLSDGIQVIFNNVIKHRLRPILADAFRDIEYQPHHDTSSLDHHDDYTDDTSNKELVRPRFNTGWSDLLTPLARILTASSFDRLLTVTIAYFVRLLEKRLWSYQGRINPLGAARLERDISGLVSAAVDVGYGPGAHAPGRYKHRETFARCVQMTLVMSMDEDEWDEVLAGGEAAEVVDKLSREERVRVRAMVRRG